MNDHNGERKHQQIRRTNVAKRGKAAGITLDKGTNSQVDALLMRTKQWREEFTALRKIVHECGLSEELKWGCPCYAHEGKNIVLIHGFKEYCALLFFKGALLKDVEGILIQQTENVQAGRQIRFTNLHQIVGMKAILKAYILQAIEVEKAGLKIVLKKTSEFKVPEEFKIQLERMPALKTAFNALTPGRQRAYLHYFSQAKQSETRQARIEKYTKQILRGKGIND